MAVWQDAILCVVSFFLFCFSKQVYNGSEPIIALVTKLIHVTNQPIGSLSPIRDLWNEVKIDQSMEMTERFRERETLNMDDYSSPKLICL